MRRASLLALATAATTAAAQESGWHFSPYPGEGDRAALGCSYASTPTNHACIAVRCADDFTITLHIDTTRPTGDAGRWLLSVDEDKSFPVVAVTEAGSPYGARIEGEIAPILDAIRNGNSFFLDSEDGRATPDRGIGLAGSLNAINQALYFCAPRANEQAQEKEANDDN